MLLHQTIQAAASNAAANKTINNIRYAHWEKPRCCLTFPLIVGVISLKGVKR